MPSHAVKIAYSCGLAVKSTPVTSAKGVTCRLFVLNLKRFALACTVYTSPACKPLNE
jgi:hypothetical protein